MITWRGTLFSGLSQPPQPTKRNGSVKKYKKKEEIESSIFQGKWPGGLTILSNRFAKNSKNTIQEVIYSNSLINMTV